MNEPILTPYRRWQNTTSDAIFYSLCILHSIENITFANVLHEFVKSIICQCPVSILMRSHVLNELNVLPPQATYHCTLITCNKTLEVLVLATINSIHGLLWTYIIIHNLLFVCSKWISSVSWCKIIEWADAYFGIEDEPDVQRCRNLFHQLFANSILKQLLWIHLVLKRDIYKYRRSARPFLVLAFGREM